jgi:hypothetical protein
LATVVYIGPRTYGTTADGGLVPFPITGYVDVAGATVSVFEDTTGALIGQATASTTPEASGQYAGWYAFVVPVSAWTAGAVGIGVPAAGAASGAGTIAITAVLGLPSAAATSGAAAISWSAAAANSLGLPSASATLSAAPIGIAAAVPLPAASATSGAAAISFTEGGGSGAIFSDTFSVDSLSSYTVDGAAGAFSVSGGKLRNTGGSTSRTFLLRSGVSAVDGTLSAKISLASALVSLGAFDVSAGVAARVASQTKWIAAELRPGGLFLLERTAITTWSDRGSYPFAPVGGTEYLVEMTLSGASVIVKLNGVTRITGTTSIASAGGFGVADGRIDDGDGFTPIQGLATFDDLTLMP